MICYLDRTFCSRWPADDCRCSDYRHLTPEMEQHARSLGLPIAYGDLCKGLPAPQAETDE